jgi:hypothetical protein
MGRLITVYQRSESAQRLQRGWRLAFVMPFLIPLPN